MKLGSDDREDGHEEDGQPCHHVAGHALLRGQDADLADDADALADGEGDRIEDLGEVAAHLVLDADGRRHQLEVLGADSPDHVVQGLLEGQSEVHLADDAVELGGDGRLRLTHHELDGLQERGTGAQGIGDEGDGVREVVVEGLQALGLAPVQPVARHPPAEDDGHQECQRVVQARQQGLAEEEGDERRTDHGSRPQGQVLRRPELQVRAGQLAGHVGAPVAPLHDAIDAGRGAPTEDAGAERSCAPETGCRGPAPRPG